jgi:excisionase family DNA binding protein
MNKREAAEYLNVSERAVERYANRGKLSVRLEKGKRGNVAVYDDGELRKLKAALDAERGVMRPAVALPDTPDQEPRQLARLSDVRGSVDFLALLSQLGNAAQTRQTLSPVELAAKHLLTLDEAATLSGLSKNHLSDAIHSGKLKAKKIGRGWKVKPLNLKSYTDKL